MLKKSLRYLVFYIPCADRPVRYITLAASTVHNKTERKTTMRKLCDKDGGENNIKNEVA